MEKSKGVVDVNFCTFDMFLLCRDFFFKRIFADRFQFQVMFILNLHELTSEHLSQQINKQGADKTANYT